MQHRRRPARSVAVGRRQEAQRGHPALAADEPEAAGEGQRAGPARGARAGGAAPPRRAARRPPRRQSARPPPARRASARTPAPGRARAAPPSRRGEAAAPPAAPHATRGHARAHRRGRQQPAHSPLQGRPPVLAHRPPPASRATGPPGAQTATQDPGQGGPVAACWRGTARGSGGGGRAAAMRRRKKPTAFPRAAPGLGAERVGDWYDEDQATPRSRVRQRIGRAGRAPWPGQHRLSGDAPAGLCACRGLSVQRTPAPCIFWRIILTQRGQNIPAPDCVHRCGVQLLPPYPFPYRSGAALPHSAAPSPARLVREDMRPGARRRRGDMAGACATARRRRSSAQPGRAARTGSRGGGVVRDSRGVPRRAVAAAHRRAARPPGAPAHSSTRCARRARSPGAAWPSGRCPPRRRSSAGAPRPAGARREHRRVERAPRPPLWRTGSPGCRGSPAPIPQSSSKGWSAVTWP